MSTTFTMRLDENQKTLISEYAAIHGMTMTELMLNATLDLIEDAIDLRTWHEAKAEHEADPITYSHDEIMKEFGLK